jgi:hypothetical protein
MYIVFVGLLTCILLAASVIVQLFVFKSRTGIWPLVGESFVFWAVGVRLLIAGLRQSRTHSSLLKGYSTSRVRNRSRWSGN